MKYIFSFLQKPYSLRVDLSKSAKAKEQHSVLWNRKHIFSFPINIGNIPLRDQKCKVTRNF